MNDHAEIFNLLPLAVSGALDAREQRRVEEHLRGCAACKAEFDTWCEIAGSLMELPTPKAPAGLAERTRRKVVASAAARRERRWNQFMIGFLIVFAWALTLLSWPVLQLVGDKFGEWMAVSSTGLAWAWIVYIGAAWLAAGVAAVFMSKRHQQEGRTV